MSGKTAYEDAQVDDIAEKVFEVRMKIKNWIDHIEHAADHACDVRKLFSCVSERKYVLKRHKASPGHRIQPFYLQEDCTEGTAARLLTDTLFPCLERVLKAAPSSWLVGHTVSYARVAQAVRGAHCGLAVFLPSSSAPER